MKYRKYLSKVSIGATIAILSLSFMSCASTTSSTNTAEEAETKKEEYDGREPASLRGEFTWLDEVGDNFGKIAAETSNRAVASQSKHEFLMKKPNWSFSYLPKTNHFYVDVQGVSYQMIQTKINDGERYAFAAEGQAENPLTISVVKNEGRSTASGAVCESEISYWSKKSKSYVNETNVVKGKACERMLTLLKDYIP